MSAYTRDYDSNIGQLFSNTSHLKEITLIADSGPHFEDMFKYWRETECRPPSCNVIACGSTNRLAKYAAQINTVPTGTTANFRVFRKCNKLPLKFSLSLPFFQLHFEGSGQVSIPCVKLSDFGIMGLDDKLAVLTNCQYDGRTMYEVRVREHYNGLIMNLMNIAKPHNLKCATHFDLSSCLSLHSDHLKQLAVVCPIIFRDLT